MVRRSRRGASAQKSGQGPPGRGIAERRFSPLRRREGPPPQPQTTRYRQKVLRFTVFCARPTFSHFSELVAQDGSTWANIGRKMGQHSPKMGQHSPKMGQHSPRWANIAPRWANIAPRWANIPPRWAHIALKIRQHSPKMGPHSPKIGRRPSKYPAFYSDFLLFPFFGSFGSTWVNMRPT